jgi:hypothetical protein
MRPTQWLHDLGQNFWRDDITRPQLVGGTTTNTQSQS